MDLAPGTILASRYRVLRELGRGGMGAVYLAEHISTGNRVALKVLTGAAAGDPDSVERFKREARAPAKIGSESVVQVLDADVAIELGGAAFLAMELLNGHDLQKLVRTRGRIHPQEVVNMMTQVARAIDKSHQIGIIHRDLKPENLFLHQREDGTSVVKILDFGISKLVSASATSAGAMTKSGEVMGTPLYMSPEQAAGRTSLIGPGADVWSLGLIVVYLLTGEAYFQGSTIPDVLSKVLGHAMYAPSRRWPFLPTSFDTWLMQSCAREPSMRFRSAGEQAAALATALAADAPTVLAMADLGLGPTHRSAQPPSGPVAPTPAARQVVVTPGYAAHTPDVAFGATMVGGSTNEPVTRTAGSGRNKPFPWLAVVLAFFAFFALAAGVVILVLSRLTSASVATKPAPSTPASSSDAVPVLVLDVPDAALTPLASAHASTQAHAPTAHASAKAAASASPSASLSDDDPTGGAAEASATCKQACDDACGNDMKCLLPCRSACK